MCVKYSGYCDLEFIPLSPEKNPIADSLCHYFYAHIKYSICPKIIPGLWTIQTVWLVRVAHWWIWFLFSYSDYFYEPDTQHMCCSTKVKTHYYNCGLRGSRQQNIQMRINAKLLNVTYHKKRTNFNWAWLWATVPNAFSTGHWHSAFGNGYDHWIKMVRLHFFAPLEMCSCTFH